MRTSADEQIRAALDSGTLTVDLVTGTIYRGARVVKGRPNTDGYLQVSVGAGRLGYTHRIVWMAAHGSIPDGMVIDHLNGDTRDNRLANLEAVSTGENTNRAVRGHRVSYQILRAFTQATGDGDERLAQALALAEKGATRREIADMVDSWASPEVP
jgi:hypothetical protein